MTGVQQQLCNLLQKGLPICRRPFQQIAERLGSAEEQVMQDTRVLIQVGIIRRIGPIVDSRALGRTGTLVAAHVPDPPLREVIEAVNRLPGVSHNYLRRHHYNLWFTLQGNSPMEINEDLSKLQGQWTIELHSLPAKQVFKLEVYFDATGREPWLQQTPEVSFTEPVELTALEREILLKVQRGLEVTILPFDALAHDAVSMDQVLKTLVALVHKGVVRRIAAVLDHRRLGFTANGLLVAEVPQDGLLAAGRALSCFTQVTHCYQRQPFPGWPYTLYAMIHGRSTDEVRGIVEEFRKSENAGQVLLLETVEELKKRPVLYRL